jgi:thiol-disulfide isomerase/thioredoxin
MRTAIGIIIASIAAVIGGLTWKGWDSKFHVGNSAPNAHFHTPTPRTPSPVTPSGPRIPERVPDIALPDLTGQPRSLKEWRGRPLIVNFWATWCEPCREEIPLLSSLQTAYGQNGKGLQVLGIAVDFRDAVASYVKKTPLAYPTLIAEEDALAPEAFGVGGGIPVSVFADSQGEIVAVKTGELHPGQAELILKLTQEIDDGRTTLSAARADIDAKLRHLAAK